MASDHRARLALFSALVFCAACSGGYSTPTTPAATPAPSTTPPPSNRSATNWKGRFGDDRSTFDATEKVFWGTVEAGTTVTRRWSGRTVQ